MLQVSFLKCIALASLVMFSFPSFSVSKAGRVKLEPALKKDFSNLVEKASDFHSAFQKENKKEVRSEITKTQRMIKKIYHQLPKISHIQQRIHSHKVLKSLESQLEMMKLEDSSYKSHKSKHIRRLFSSFFELAHVYNLKNETTDRVFYCYRDRSIWFQSESDPKNPVNPNYKNCGRQVW